MFPQIRLFAVTAVAGALLTPAIAAAQAPPQPKDRIVPKEELSGPQDCVNTRATADSGLDIENPEGRSFSEQLAAGQGVICPPPRVDPEMKEPAPGGGVTPVIPPPGSDEDRKGIEPK